MHDIKINSTTGSEIVTTQDVKDFVRIDTSSDDAIIGRMIIAARTWCENYIGRDIVAKNRTFYLEEVDQRFTLPFSPIASISSVTSKGTDISYDSYGLDDKIIEIGSLPADEVKVTYITTGITDDLIKEAILHLVSTYYDNRADFKVGDSISEIPTSTKNILQSFKSMYF
jgi:uncharacterized phiE125 gp8 family phage protein